MNNAKQRITMFPQWFDYSILTKDNLFRYSYDKPLKDKGDILYYLKHFSDKAIIGMKKAVDPISNTVISNYTEVYEIDKLLWSNTMIFLFEKYDIILDDIFIKEVRKRIKLFIKEKT